MALAGCAKTPTPDNWVVPEGVTPEVFRAFVASNPCPGRVVGWRNLVCPSHVAMHHVPLCAGGDDVPSNLRWVPIEARAKKEREDRARCAKR
jgi:hypothetical protein